MIGRGEDEVRFEEKFDFEVGFEVGSLERAVSNCGEEVADAGRGVVYHLEGEGAASNEIG